MIQVTCRLTAKNRDLLRNPTLGNRIWATLPFPTRRQAPRLDESIVKGVPGTKSAMHHCLVVSRSRLQAGQQCTVESKNSVAYDNATGSQSGQVTEPAVANLFLYHSADSCSGCRNQRHCPWRPLIVVADVQSTRRTEISSRRRRLITTLHVAFCVCPTPLYHGLGFSYLK